MGGDSLGQPGDFIASVQGHPPGRHRGTEKQLLRALPGFLHKLGLHFLGGREVGEWKGPSRWGGEPRGGRPGPECLTASPGWDPSRRGAQWQDRGPSVVPPQACSSSPSGLCGPISCPPRLRSAPPRAGEETPWGCG